jgi:uncharacterized protein
MQLAARVAEAMQRVQQQPTAAAVADIKPERWMRAARESLLAQFDSEHGGIGSGGGPKFPSSPDLALLLNDFRIHGDQAARSAVTSTLDAMAFGGVHDHLGGGFHRYSTEPTWSIPHRVGGSLNTLRIASRFARAFSFSRSRVSPRWAGSSESTTTYPSHAANRV